jgi:hypothetical protein
MGKTRHYLWNRRLVGRSYRTLTAKLLINPLVFSPTKRTISYSYVVQLDIFNGDLILSALQKQKTAVTQLKITKWRNYFCDDVKYDANVRDKNFLHKAISVNCTSNFWKLVKANTCKYWGRMFLWNIDNFLPDVIFSHCRTRNMQPSARKPPVLAWTNKHVCFST